MKPTKHIENCRYAMQISGGGDVWRIFGEVEGSPICPSSPVKLDPENDQFESHNSIYKIESYAQPKDEFWKQMKEDLGKGFEIH